VCGQRSRRIYQRKVRWVRDLSTAEARVYLEVEVRRVLCRHCEKVKQEKLPWLSDNPFYTKRFAFFVGRRCRKETIRDVAHELRLDWKTVKDLEKQYMREQLRRVGTPAPKAVGIDEVSIRKGHTYRIVVSDLIRRRPIWSTIGWDPRKTRASGSPSWTCGNRSETPRGLTLCKRASSSTNST
jgi:transposase